LRLALLSMHRASVKAAGNAGPAPAALHPENPKASLIEKLFKMRSAAQQRQAIPGTAAERDDG
jgi:hypothetical protein